MIYAHHSGARRIVGLRHATRKFLIAEARRHPGLGLSDLRDRMKQAAGENNYPYDSDLVAEAAAIARRKL